MLLVYYSIMSMVISSRENLMQALLTSDKRKRPRNLSRTSGAVETLVLGGWDCGARGLGRQSWPKSNCDKADLLLQLNGYCLLFHENDTPTVWRSPKSIRTRAWDWNQVEARCLIIKPLSLLSKSLISFSFSLLRQFCQTLESPSAKQLPSQG